MKKRTTYLMPIVLMWLCSLSVLGQTNNIATVILVRHAEKAANTDGNPGLSEKGVARAQDLADVLSEVSIDEIYSTPFKRTRETMKVLAEERKVDVKEYNPFKLDEVIDLVENSKGKTIILSGHSNTTPIIINKLLGKEKYKPLDEKDYDNLYIVSFLNVGEAKVIQLQYGEASLIENK